MYWDEDKQKWIVPRRSYGSDGLEYPYVTCDAKHSWLVVEKDTLNVVRRFSKTFYGDVLSYHEAHKTCEKLNGIGPMTDEMRMLLDQVS